MSVSVDTPDSAEITRLRHRLVHASIRHPQAYDQHAAAVVISAALDAAATSPYVLESVQKAVAELPDHEIGQQCPGEQVAP